MSSSYLPHYKFCGEQSPIESRRYDESIKPAIQLPKNNSSNFEEDKMKLPNSYISKSFEELLQSYAKRRELLKNSHYFGVNFPAIKINKSTHEQTEEDDISHSESQPLTLPIPILPVPRRYTNSASGRISPARRKKDAFSARKSVSVFTNRFPKRNEPEIKNEVNRTQNESNFKIKPTLTNTTLIITNMEEMNNIEKNQLYFNMQILTVYDIKFVDFIPNLNAIASECKYLQTLELHRSQVDGFQHLEEIAQLRNLQNLTLGSNGNAIVRVSFWYLYLVHRMAHLSLKTINGIKISPELCTLAAQKFGPAVHMLRLSRRQRQSVFDKQTLMQEVEENSEEENQRINCRLISAINQAEDCKITEAAGMFVDKLIAISVQSYKRDKIFHQTWPKCFTEAVRDALSDLNKEVDLKSFTGEKNNATLDE